MTNENRPPLPPFTLETARQKVRMAQDAWNTREPQRVVRAYTHDSQWRNRDEFLQGRDAILAFLERKWQKELEYRLVKQLWSFNDNRIAVRFFYEWHDATGEWYRSHGNELWEFDALGLMRRREASINDTVIKPEDRLLLDDETPKNWDETWWDEPRPQRVPKVLNRALTQGKQFMKTGHIGINVSDINRSKEFYAQAFGLELINESQETGREFAFLGENGTLTITLWQQSQGQFDAKTPGLHHLSFQVEDIQQVREAESRVRELGAEFIYNGVVSHSEGAQSGGIFFRDPDGIRLEIYAPTGAQESDAPSGSAKTCGFF